MKNSVEESGGRIDCIYHCPELAKFNPECRKPNPGMILQAIEEYNIDPVKSVLIGDKKRDIQAGINAGVGKNLYIQDKHG